MQQRKSELFNHGVLFYRNPTREHELVFDRLKEELDQGRGMFYIAGDDSPKKIYQEMLNFGFDVKTLEREGMLKITSSDGWYVIDGKFDYTKLKVLWKKTYEETLERGLKGLFVCGEMSVFFEHNLVEDLLKYEKSIGRTIKIPISGFCAYKIQDLRLLKVKQLFDLVRSHNQVFSPKFAGMFDFEDYYCQILSENLEPLVGKICAKEILSFFGEWKQLLDVDLGEGYEDLHTALEGLIGSRAKRIAEKVWLRMYEKLGLGSSCS